MAVSPKTAFRRASRNSEDGSFHFPLIAHSQTVTTRHPSAVNWTVAMWSRFLFAVILVCQNSTRVAGQRNSRQSCPCQKQPCTNMTARHFGRTMSGRPGRSPLWRRNLNPIAWSAFRTTISGLVLRERICAILKWRCSGVSQSATGQVPIRLQRPLGLPLHPHLASQAEGSTHQT